MAIKLGLFTVMALAIISIGALTSNAQTASPTTTLGLPDTGAGGNATTPLVLLVVAGLALLGSATYIVRKLVR